MKDRRLAARYARALLASLPDPGQAEAAESFLLALGEAIEQADLRAMLLNPAIPASARIQVLASLAERAGLAKRVVSFLHTVVDKGRIGQLPAIAREFQQTREKAQGIAAATVSTVAPLPPDLADRVRQSLERLTGQRVRMTCALDPSLIGGVVTRVGSMVYDGSLRTQLLDLRRKMVEE